MRFYWIDSYSDYDTAFGEAVLKVFRGFYEPLARECGVDFSFLDATEIQVRSGARTELMHAGRNILDGDCCAVVQYSNISPKIEKHLESIYRIVRSENKLFNASGAVDFVDRDKMFGLSLANSLGIPTIPALLLSRKKNYKAYVGEAALFLGEPPYIVKPKEMLSGLGIIKADSGAQFASLLDIVMTSSKDFIAQKFIPAPSDYRVYVVDGAAKYCLLRTPPKGDFLANISLGGTALAADIPEELAGYARAIYQKVKAPFLCVDFLKSDGKYYFNEIETAGGFHPLPEPVNKQVGKDFFDVAKKYFGH